MKRLTTQMHAEIRSINIRTVDIKENILTPFSEELFGLRNGGLHSHDPNDCLSVNAELITFKVRLENILCETDIKEQVQNLNFNDDNPFFNTMCPFLIAFS